MLMDSNKNFAAIRELPPVEGDGVIVVSGDQLEMTPVRWLWPGWLAGGKLHLLAGEPGQGKTTIAAALAAIVSAGGTFPDGTPCETGNVMFWSGEDDPADTLKPRLVAAGADVRNVHFVTGMVVRGRDTVFSPARDMEALVAEANQIGNVRLLVLDPVVSAVKGDSHKNTEVRKDMEPLVEWAAQTGAAIIGITHFSKGGKNQNPAQRVSGSVAFTAVARVVLVAGKVDGDGTADKRVLARAKSNFGQDSGGFEYEIQQTEVAQGISASRIVWGSHLEGPAKTLLAGSKSGPKSAVEEAEAFLVEVLGGGVMSSTDVWATGEAAGHSKKTLQRAARNLKVRHKPREGKWEMSLPDADADVGEADDLLPDGEDHVLH
jgi:RecA-family ATPase